MEVEARRPTRDRLRSETGVPVKLEERIRAGGFATGVGSRFAVALPRYCERLSILGDPPDVRPLPEDRVPDWEQDSGEPPARSTKDFAVAEALLRDFEIIIGQALSGPGHVLLDEHPDIAGEGNALRRRLRLQRVEQALRDPHVERRGLFSARRDAAIRRIPSYR